MEHKTKKEPDFSIAIVTDAKVEGEPSRFTYVGVGFINPKSETITILSDALPGDKLLLMKPLKNKDLDIDKVVKPEKFSAKPKNPNYPFDGY